MAKATRKKKRRLGKGLESLLSKPVEVSPPDPVKKDIADDNSCCDVEIGAGSTDLDSSDQKDVLAYISIDLISPNPRQPRQVFDDDGLSSLADSIKNAGPRAGCRCG